MTLPVLRGRGLSDVIIWPLGIVGDPMMINHWKFGAAVSFFVKVIPVFCLMANPWTLTPGITPSACTKTHRFDNFESGMPYERSDRVWSRSIEIPRRSLIKCEPCKRTKSGQNRNFNPKWPTICDTCTMTLIVNSECFGELYKCTKFQVSTIK